MGLAGWVVGWITGERGWTRNSVSGGVRTVMGVKEEGKKKEKRSAKEIGKQVSIRKREENRILHSQCCKSREELRGRE